VAPARITLDVSKPIDFSRVERGVATIGVVRQTVTVGTASNHFDPNVSDVARINQERSDASDFLRIAQFDHTARVFLLAVNRRR
jgi:hypothetical protein